MKKLEKAVVENDDYEIAQIRQSLVNLNYESDNQTQQTEVK